MDKKLTELTAKLDDMIKSNNEKRTSLLARIRAGDIGVQFLALEYKIMSSEVQTQFAFLKNEIEKISLTAETEKTHQDNEFKSQCAIFQDQMYNEINGLLDTEFSCAICTEVFIQPSVIECGHTFCYFCISRWVGAKHICPICRKGATTVSKHFEMDNFLTKIHAFLSQEVQERRQQRISERETEVVTEDNRPIRLEDYYSRGRWVYSDHPMNGRDPDTAEFVFIPDPPVGTRPEAAANGIPDHRDYHMRQHRLAPSSSAIARPLDPSVATQAEMQQNWNAATGNMASIIGPPLFASPTVDNRNARSEATGLSTMLNYFTSWANSAGLQVADQPNIALARAALEAMGHPLPQISPMTYSTPLTDLRNRNNPPPPAHQSGMIHTFAFPEHLEIQVGDGRPYRLNGQGSFGVGQSVTYSELPTTNGGPFAASMSHLQRPGPDHYSAIQTGNPGPSVNQNVGGVGPNNPGRRSRRHLQIIDPGSGNCVFDVQSGPSTTDNGRGNNGN